MVPTAGQRPWCGFKRTRPLLQSSRPQPTVWIAAAQWEGCWDAAGRNAQVSKWGRHCSRRCNWWHTTCWTPQQCSPERQTDSKVVWVTGDHRMSTTLLSSSCSSISHQKPHMTSLREEHYCNGFPKGEHYCNGCMMPRTCATLGKPLGREEEIHIPEASRRWAAAYWSTVGCPFPARQCQGTCRVQRRYSHLSVIQTVCIPLPKCLGNSTTSSLPQTWPSHATRRYQALQISQGESCCETCSCDQDLCFPLALPLLASTASLAGPQLWSVPHCRGVWPRNVVGCMAHTSRTQGLCQPFHTTQTVFSTSLDHVVSGEGHSYLTAISPSRAQQVLWICDVALCTYLRCSHDSKSSPHPPSVICLESRNWQAWATSLHATLQRQTVRQGWVQRRACMCFPDTNGSCASPCP